MKTLADLKRDCQKYVWIMREHSWFPSGKLIGVPRKIQKVQSKALQFEPLVAGEQGSWLAWPKASELKISEKENKLFVEVSGEGCSIVYELEAA